MIRAHHCTIVALQTMHSLETPVLFTIAEPLQESTEWVMAVRLEAVGETLRLRDTEVGDTGRYEHTSCSECTQ